MSIVYRTPGGNDWQAIDRVYRSVFCTTFGHLYSPENLDAYLSGFTEASWTSELRDQAFAFLLAEDNGELVGFIKIGPRALPVASSGRGIVLRQLFVLPDWQGHGIAQELIRCGIDAAQERGADEMFLTVYAENHRARRFYERWGFEYIGPYTFMVGDHRHEDIIMRRLL